MIEAEKRIREALADGPTPGPWHHDSDPVKNDPLHRVRFRVTAKGRTITETYYSSAQPGAPFTSGEADNRFIAACSPENIATLLAEIDRLRAAVQHEADCVEAANAEIARLTRERDEALAARDAMAKALEPFTGNATHYGAGGIYTLGVYGRDLIAARDALAQIEKERA